MRDVCVFARGLELSNRLRTDRGVERRSLTFVRGSGGNFVNFYELQEITFLTKSLNSVPTLKIEPPAEKATLRAAIALAFYLQEVDTSSIIRTERFGEEVLSKS